MRFHTGTLSTTSFLLSILSRTCAQSSTTKPILNSEADIFIQQVLETWNSPGGFSVAVVRKDGPTGEWIRETKGYGNATLDGDEFTENTLVSIASNSKLFTSVSTGLLIHNKTLSPPLSWTSKLADRIPGFGLEDPVAVKGVTIIDAMSHRTGMPAHDAAAKTYDDVPALIKKLRYLRPSAEFRDTWQYSNHMYGVLSYLPTAIIPSGISYTRYVKQYILDPLGMSSTTYSSIIANNTGNLADGLIRTAFFEPNGSQSNRPPARIPFWSPAGEDGAFTSGSGGVISNAKDLATWLQFLLLSGRNPVTNETIVPSAVFEQINKGITVDKGSSLIFGGFPEFGPIVYGGGQEIGSYQGVQYIEHDGHVQGFHSVILRCPNNDFGVAVVSNDEDAGLFMVQLVKFWLLEQALNLKKIDWTARAQELAGALNNSDSSTPRPSNATFPYKSGDISSVAGRYENPGYGPAEFCYVFPTNSTNSSSSSCKELVASKEVQALIASTSDAPTLVAKWDQYWVSYFVMKHFDGAVFNLTGYIMIPTGDKRNPFYAYAQLTGGTVEVDQALSGMGMTGVWGAGDGVPEPQGKNIKDRAEVWFSRSGL